MTETQITRKAFEQLDAAYVPNRYSIRGKGEERILVCNESPTISVRIKRGTSVSAGEGLDTTLPSAMIYSCLIALGMEEEIGIIEWNKE